MTGNLMIEDRSVPVTLEIARDIDPYKICLSEEDVLRLGIDSESTVSLTLDVQAIGEATRFEDGRGRESWSDHPRSREAHKISMPKGHRLA